MKFFGFSKTIYPEWEKRVSSNSSFLSSGPSQLTKYFKKNKITPSLIFDNLGLFHLIYSGENISHLKELHLCLPIGGKIISSVNPIGRLKGNMEMVESFGFSIETFKSEFRGKTGEGVVLTKIK